MATVEQTNPLIEGLERLPVHPTTLVIFGGTGDLAHRKLLPAVYNLAHEGALPERFNLIAVSRSDIPHGDYQGMARESITEYSRRTPDEAASPGPERRSVACGTVFRSWSSTSRRMVGKLGASSSAGTTRLSRSASRFPIGSMG